MMMSERGSDLTKRGLGAALKCERNGWLRKAPGKRKEKSMGRQKETSAVKQSAGRELKNHSYGSWSRTFRL